jgi:enoyl-CoA hydratase
MKAEKDVPAGTAKPDLTASERIAAGEPVLLSETRGAVRLLTLNNQASRNALTPELICRLADAFQAAASDPAILAVVLTGAGERAFCSGGDLRATLPLLTGARPPRDEWDHRLLDDPSVLSRSALREEGFDKPVIAAVNGVCVAGGMETLLATDIRIAAEHAIFGLPEVRLGLVPFAGALVRLPLQTSYCAAMQIMLSGEPVDAHAALRLGLVNEVLPSPEVLPRALAIAERIAANGPVAVQRLKRTVLAAFGRPLAEGFQLEDENRRAVLATEDAREGPRAFAEKRKPRFKGA